MRILDGEDGTPQETVHEILEESDDDSDLLPQEYHVWFIVWWEGGVPHPSNPASLPKELSSRNSKKKAAAASTSRPNPLRDKVLNEGAFPIINNTILELKAI